MKEATGELSTTVIAIVAIAAIAGLFTVFLLPMLRANIILGQACGNGAGYKQDGEKYKVSCDTAASGATSWTCHYIDSKSKDTTKICYEKTE